MAIGPPPRNSTRRGTSLELEHRLVGQVSDLGEPGDRRHDRMTARAQQDEPGRHRSSSPPPVVGDGDLVRTGHATLAPRT